VPAGKPVGDGHFSSPPVARRVERPTRESVTGRADPAPLLGLAPGGVYPAGPVTRAAVRSYIKAPRRPHHFTLTFVLGP